MRSARLSWLPNLIVLGAGMASAWARDPMLPTTTAPIVYMINYSGDYFEKLDYIEQFRAAPPDMLHMGKAVPISHLWGPIKLYAGENQSTGGPNRTLSWENIALLEPGALQKRIDNIRQTLVRYHAIGIREIVPYISYHTLAGDHETRQGFWKFYDVWEKYVPWAGPRPTRDPFDWLVVDKTGKLVPGSCGGYSPDYYAPLHRYRACINHPDWSEWHRRLVRMVAEVGYDGCFVDNTHPDPCYCRYCKDLFRKFLDESKSLVWVERLTRDLPRESLTLGAADVPPELVRRWRLLCTARHLGNLREVGRKVKPGFTIFPNGNSLPECLLTGSQTDRLMFESTYSPGLARESSKSKGASQFQALVCQTHMAALQYAQHMHAKAICLGYEASKAGMENVQSLALAETAAFSGGGGFSGKGEPQAKYRAFFKKHPDLFAGWLPTAPAAVLFSGWGHNRLGHTRPVTTGTIHEQAAGMQRLLVALVDTSLPDEAGPLSAFRVIYLGAISYDVSIAQLAALRDYARRGGKLVLGGPKTEINGQPAASALEGVPTATWNPAVPILSTEPVASGDGPVRNLRFALYCQKDRLALHVVNYNVHLADSDRRVEDVGPLPVTLPVPAEWKSARATCFDPDAIAASAECVVSDGRARLTLPKCYTYKIVLVERLDQ